MNSFTFENKGTNTYLVYEISENDNIDTMNLGMLTNNKIPGLANAIFTQSDSTKFLKYNVSSKISAKQFLTGPVNKKRIIGVFSGIVEAMISAEDYMISQNSLMLDLDYVFSDVSSCETVMICLPLIDEDNQIEDLGGFFRQIMFSTQFDQTENCDYVARIINYLNSAPVFSLTDFKNLLNEIKNGKTEKVESRQSVQSSVSKNVSNVKAQPTVQPQQPITPKPVSKPAVEQPVVNAVKPPVQTYQPVSQQPTKNNINIPNQQYASAPASPENSEPKANSDGKKMSLFGLLMHYNKENAALYKAQREEKQVSGTSVAKPMQVKAPRNQGNNKRKSAAPVSYAVPGAPGNNVPPTPPVKSVPQTPSINQNTNNKPSYTPAPNPTVPPTTQAYVPPVTSQGHPANFGETTVLGGGMIGETTVLGNTSVDSQPKPHLIRAKNNESINLDKPVFRIGKEKSYVDYFISDNTAISRSHANIITRDDKYFIVDTNSTNHTYINGGMIQSNVETPLSHGTKIRLANEEFEFRLY